MSLFSAWHAEQTRSARRRPSSCVAADVDGVGCGRDETLAFGTGPVLAGADAAAAGIRSASANATSFCGYCSVPPRSVSPGPPAAITTYWVPLRPMNVIGVAPPAAP